MRFISRVTKEEWIGFITKGITKSNKIGSSSLIYQIASTISPFAIILVTIVGGVVYFSSQSTPLLIFFGIIDILYFVLFLEKYVFKKEEFFLNMFLQFLKHITTNIIRLVLMRKNLKDIEFEVDVDTNKIELIQSQTIITADQVQTIRYDNEIFLFQFIDSKSTKHAIVIKPNSHEEFQVLLSFANNSLAKTNGQMIAL
jgi:hypothetical protein